MRKLVFILFLLFPALLKGQQMAGSFREVSSKAGITLEELDNQYQSALHAQPELAVFNGQEEAFIEAYKSMLFDLATFLKENEFIWGKTTRCFNRIYLNKEGGIDYFLYNFKAGEIDPEKEKQFKALLSRFIENYQFPLTAKQKFAQCSPVSYLDY